MILTSDFVNSPIFDKTNTTEFSLLSKHPTCEQAVNQKQRFNMHYNKLRVDSWKIVSSGDLVVI